MTRPRLGLARCLVAGALIALAACGTTVHNHAGLGSTTGGGQDNLAQGSTTEQPSGTSTLPPGAAASGSSGGSGGSGVGSPSTDVGSGAGVSVGSGAFAAPSAPVTFAPGVPGVTATTISIGLGYAVNNAAANAAIGANGITQGDQKGYEDAIVKEINSHGGIFGRKLVPVYHQYDSTSTATLDSQFQAACADWTQDHKVFAAFDGESETLIRCMENAGVLLIEDNLTAFDDATFQTFPDYYEPGNFSVDRMMLDEVPGLAAQKYFSGWNAVTGGPSPTHAKIGVLTYDHSTTNHAVDQVLTPALAQLGYRPTDVAKVLYPKATSDIGSVAAGVSSAVLKFHNDGVDHVLIVDVTGTLTLLFLNNAQSQRYFPRYGFNTQNGAEALISAGDAPAAQVVGSLGIGWSPGLDLTSGDNPNNGPYSTQTRRDCLALMARNGFSFPNANAAAVALGTCNSFNFLLQVLGRAQAPINRAAFQRAVGGLGASFVPTDVLAPTSFGPTKHYGGATYRYWDYVPSCTCMRYTSGAIPG